MQDVRHFVEVLAVNPAILVHEMVDAHSDIQFQQSHHVVAPDCRVVFPLADFRIHFF